MKIVVASPTLRYSFYRVPINPAQVAQWTPIMLGYPGALATDSPVQSLLQRLHTFLMVYDDPLMSVPMPKSARNRVAMLRRHIPMIGGQRPPNPLLRIRARLLALQADARTSTTLR